MARVSTNIGGGGTVGGAIVSLTNNTGGTVSNTLADVPSSYNEATLSNQLASLASKVNEIIVILRKAGLAS